MITRQSWYQNYNVMMEIIYQQMNRETVFLPVSKDGRRHQPIRWINAGYIAILKRNMDFFKFMEKLQNLYFSLATYKNMPQFSFDRFMKGEEQKLWLDHFHEYITSYDFLMETDNPNWKVSYAESKKIKELLDRFNVQYSLKFSGKKGFHFIIPYDNWAFLNKPIYIPYQKKVYEHDDLIGYMKIFAEVFFYLEGMKAIDLTIFDVKRICKTGYSWDCNSDMVALPLLDNEFEKFDISMAKPENVLRLNMRYRRPVLMRRAMMPLQQRQSNLKALIKHVQLNEIIESRRDAYKATGVER